VLLPFLLDNPFTVFDVYLYFYVYSFSTISIFFSDHLYLMLKTPIFFVCTFYTEGKVF